MAVFFIISTSVSAQTITETSQVEVPYRSITVENPELYPEQSGLTQQGSCGYANMITETTTFFFSDDEITTRYQVVSLPIDEITTIGTKQYPTIFDNTGTIIFPCNGIVTSTDKYGSHAGYTAIDVANATGTPIYAPADGIITRASWYCGYGNCIEMTCGSYSFLFGHLSDFNCEVGQEVTKGQIIGYMGNTGYSTGSHLHLEVYIDGIKQYIPNVFNLGMGDVI